MAQRGRGWLVRYPVGSTEAGPGLPLVNAERWDAGVELRIGREPLSLAVAVTQGSLCDPRVEDDNDGKQVSGRLAWTPSPALVVGVSGAVGDFLSREVDGRRCRPPRGARFRQEALGARPRVVARLLDRARGGRLEPLDPAGARRDADRGPARRAWAVFVEARYKMRPGLYVAGPRRAAGVLRDRQRARPADLGRAGDAGRGRRGLRPAAARAPQGVVAAQLARRRRAWRRTTSWPGRSSCGSEIPARSALALAGVAASARPRRSRGRRAGAIRGRVDVRREPASSEGRPAVAELGHHAPRDVAGPPAQRRLPRDGAAGGLRDPGPRTGRARPAERDLRALRPRGHRRHDRRLPEQRPHLPQRLLALEAEALRPRPLPRGQSRSVRFDRPGVVRVFCEIHSHMSAFILVFAHRYFATTDAEGRYRIEGVPPGTYTLAVWNDGAVRARREVRVAGAGRRRRAGLHGGVMARPLRRSARASSRPPRSWRCCRSPWPSVSSRAG